MSEEGNNIIFVVVVSTAAIAILLLAVIDLLLLYRNRKLKHQRELEERNRKIDDLLQKQEVENVNAMLKGQDEERKRIAQELHDRIGSILSTVKLHFSSIEDAMKVLQKQQNQSYNEAVGLLDEAVDEVRRISHDLYEGSLAKFGFATALRQLIAAIEKANIIKIDFINSIEGEVDITEFEQGLYRITQELLSNTLKYADAKQITIQLNKSDTGILYMYEDDGKGFTTAQAKESAGIGYKNIEARVAKINGSWDLDTRPGHGMTLTIEIPIK
jgi:signal transduction histidine kinase